MDYEHYMGTFVISAGDGPESFLACGVPDLELALLLVDFEGFELEVDTNGGGVVLEVGVLAEAEKDAGLTDALASHDDDLEQVVVLSDHLDY